MVTGSRCKILHYHNSIYPESTVILRFMIVSLLRCVNTEREATRSEGWQPSRVVPYVTLAQNRPTI